MQSGPIKAKLIRRKRIGVCNMETMMKRLDGIGYTLGIVQDFKIWPYLQMVYAKTTETVIFPRQQDTCNKILWAFEIKTDHGTIST